MSAWTIYLITVASSLSVVAKLIAALGGLAASAMWIIVGFAVAVDEPDSIKFAAQAKPKALLITKIAIVMVLLAVVTPTFKQMTAIIGVSYLTQVDQIGNLPPKAVRALNKLLDDYTAEDK